MNEGETRANQQVLWIKRLYREFEQICYTYKVKIPKPLILISENHRQLGLWDPLQQSISLSERLLHDYPWYVVVEVFKHEMAHYLADLSVEPDDSPHGSAHGPAFKKACERLGVEAWAQSATVDIGESPKLQNLYELDENAKRLQSKISKLLNLSQSNNEHEANLAMQKARELQRSYNLDSKAESDFISLLVCTGKKKIGAPHTRICSILTKYFFVDVVHKNYYDAKQMHDFKGFEILGSRSNVVIAEYAFSFLARQLDSLWREYKKSNGIGGLRQKNSYQLGVVHGFEQSLKQQTQVSSESAKFSGQHENLLIPAWSKDPALTIYKNNLQSYLGRRYPRLHTRGTSRSRVFGSTFAEGSTAGQRIRIHQGLSSGSESAFGGYLGK